MRRMVGLFLSVSGDEKWKEAEHGSHVENSAKKKFDLRDPTSLVDEVYFGMYGKRG